MSPVARMYVMGAILGVLGSSALITSVFAANDVKDVTGATTEGTQMYAGPNAEYPQVMHLAAGLQVAIHGCVAGQAWCDVSWRGKRGWVTAAALEYSEKGESVALTEVAPSVIPTATFELGRYWDANYKTRLWYSDRAKWQGLEGHGVQAADAGAP